jgi:hypothetical protein
MPQSGIRSIYNNQWHSFSPNNEMKESDGKLILNVHVNSIFGNKITCYKIMNQPDSDK